MTKIQGMDVFPEKKNARGEKERGERERRRKEEKKQKKKGGKDARSINHNLSQKKEKKSHETNRHPTKRWDSV